MQNDNNNAKSSSAIDAKIAELAKKCEANAASAIQYGCEVNDDCYLEEIHSLQKIKKELEAEKQEAMSKPDNSSSRNAIDAVYLTARCKYGSDILNEVLDLLRRMEYAAYKKGVIDMLGQISELKYELEARQHMFEDTDQKIGYNKAMRESIDFLDELLSQYNKQGAVAEK